MEIGFQLWLGKGLPPAQCISRSNTLECDRYVSPLGSHRVGHSISSSEPDTLPPRLRPNNRTRFEIKGQSRFWWRHTLLGRYPLNSAARPVLVFFRVDEALRLRIPLWEIFVLSLNVTLSISLINKLIHTNIQWALYWKIFLRHPFLVYW